MAQITELSAYHQQNLEATKQHLTGSNLSVAPFSSSLRAELEKIWTRPTLYSSFMHGKVDALGQFEVGSRVFKEIVRGLGDVRIYHTLWETHPRGMGTVTLSYPAPDQTLTAPLGQPLPNFTQWRLLADIEEDIATSLSQTAWSNLKRQIQQGSSYNSAQIKLASSAVDQIASVYDDAVNSSLREHRTLTGFAEHVRDVMSIDLGIKGSGPEVIPYSVSQMKDDINKSLGLLDQEIGLERILAQAVDDRTAANLFVGGSADRLLRIGYSLKKSQFQATEYDARDQKRKYYDRKVIDKQAVLDLLDHGQVIPSGIPALVALIAASSVTPVAHFGSEYGTALPVSRALSLSPTGYLQVIDDFRDGWSPIEITNTSDGQPVRVTYSTMALWKKAHGVDWASVIDRSVSSGEPMKVEGIFDVS